MAVARAGAISPGEALLGRRNGVSTAYSYDTLSRILQALHQKGTTLIESAGYAYDAAGNRFTRMETVPAQHGISTKTAG